MSNTSELMKLAQKLVEKKSFVPMPGGQPPADPAMMQDPAMGGAPMDPSMDPAMAGAPMDPAAMAGGAPMDPAMGGAPQPPMSIIEMAPEELYAMIVSAILEAISTASNAAAQAAPPPAEPAPAPVEEPKKPSGSAAVEEKLDQVISLLGGGDAAGAAGGTGIPPLPGQQAAPGFVSTAPGAPGMVAQAFVEEIPTEERTTSVSDLIINRVVKAGK